MFEFKIYVYYIYRNKTNTYLNLIYNIGEITLRYLYGSALNIWLFNKKIIYWQIVIYTYLQDVKYTQIFIKSLFSNLIVV